MDQIVGFEQVFVSMCIDFARQFLILPDTINMYFDDCPSKRFSSEFNAAESDNQNIYLNKRWYRNHIEDHHADVAFFVFHELRHMHQLMSIDRLQRGLPVQEPKDTIFEWRNNYNNYVRNVDADSQEINIKQPIELDANAYGICLMHIYYQLYLDKADADLRVSLPESIIDLSYERAQEYAYSKEEIIRYTTQFQQKVNTDTKKAPSVTPRKNKKKKECRRDN